MAWCCAVRGCGVVSMSCGIIMVRAMLRLCVCVCVCVCVCARVCARACVKKKTVVSR